jgi:chromosome segregation ATPase
MIEDEPFIYTERDKEAWRLACDTLITKLEALRKENQRLDNELYVFRRDGLGGQAAAAHEKLEEVRAEHNRHMGLVKEHLATARRRLTEVEAENATLKTEVELLRSSPSRASMHSDEIQRLIKTHDKKENEAAAHYKRSLDHLTEQLHAVQRVADNSQASLLGANKKLEAAEKRAAALGEQLKGATVELNEARENIKSFTEEPKAYREKLKAAQSELAVEKKKNAESDNYKDLYARSRRIVVSRDCELGVLRKEIIRLQQELEISTCKLKARENRFTAWEPSNGRSFACIDIPAC